MSLLQDNSQQTTPNQAQRSKSVTVDMGTAVKVAKEVQTKMDPIDETESPKVKHQRKVEQQEQQLSFGDEADPYESLSPQVCHT